MLFSVLMEASLAKWWLKRSTCACILISGPCLTLYRGRASCIAREAILGGWNWKTPGIHSSSSCYLLIVLDLCMGVENRYSLWYPMHVGVQCTTRRIVEYIRSSVTWRYLLFSFNGLHRLSLWPRSLPSPHYVLRGMSWQGKRLLCLISAPFQNPSYRILRYVHILHSIKE